MNALLAALLPLAAAAADVTPPPTASGQAANSNPVPALCASSCLIRAYPDIGGDGRPAITIESAGPDGTPSGEEVPVTREQVNRAEADDPTLDDRMVVEIGVDANGDSVYSSVSDTERWLLENAIDEAERIAAELNGPSVGDNGPGVWGGDSDGGDSSGDYAGDSWGGDFGDFGGSSDADDYLTDTV